MLPSWPIAVIDSGLGGLTVVRALRAALPAEEIVYFGDTARLPYGSKSAGTITEFIRQIITYLQPLGPKHIVIACNTATALALNAIRVMFPGLSISGVIDPGAKAAVIAAGPRRAPIIGILATEATIRSKAYERAILRRRSHAKLLLRPAPLLVPIIEEGRRLDDPLVELAVRQYLEPFLDHQMDVLVMGCTHYPILRKVIAAVAGPQVRLIDSAAQCADDVAARLRDNGLLHPPAVAGATSNFGSRLKCFVTDDPIRFATLAGRFLGTTIDPPTLVSPESLYTDDPHPTPLSLRRPA